MGSKQSALVWSSRRGKKSVAVARVIMQRVSQFRKSYIGVSASSDAK